MASRSMPTGRKIAFGDYELLVEDYRLTHRGEPVATEPQVFDVLCYLATNAGRLVTKEELLDQVWGDRFVSESALTSRIKAARRAIGDNGRSQHTIKTIHGRGYQFVAATLDRDVDAGGARRPRLPRASRPLIGRHDELEELSALVRDCRLVTITGPGGVGKTRLAIELAGRIALAGELEAVFVPLSQIDQVDQVGPMIAETLGVARESRSTAHAALHEALRGRSVLLVIDNFEHLVDAAPLLAELLEIGEELVCVVTSRERLGLSAEMVYPLQPLPEAVELFEQAAVAVEPGFVVSAEIRPAVTSLCHLLDRLPLAVELAAAQVRMLPLPDIERRLRSRLASISDRSRDRPARHQTISQTIEWSVDLLAPDEQRLLVRLGIFVGGFALDAAESICGDDAVPDVFEALTSLVDKSLVLRAEDAPEPRFTMLHLVRQFASNRLRDSGEADLLARRHATFIAESMARIEKLRWGPMAGAWTTLVETDYANTEAALTWAFEHDAELGCRIVGALSCYWSRGDHAGGRRWTDAALRHVEACDPMTRALVHLGAGYIAFGDRNLDEARIHWQQAHDLFESLGERLHHGLALVNLASCAIGRPDPKGASMAAPERAVELARDLGSETLLAHALNVRGEMARVAGDFAVAESAYAEALAINRRLGDKVYESVVLANYLYIELNNGDPNAALEAGWAALELCWSVGMRIGAAWSVSELALPHHALGMSEKAARLVGASRAALEHQEVGLGPADHPMNEQLLRDLEADLGASRLDELIAEGHRLNLAEAVEYALDTTGGHGAPPAPAR